MEPAQLPETVCSLAYAATRAALSSSDRSSTRGGRLPHAEGVADGGEPVPGHEGGRRFQQGRAGGSGPLGDGVDVRAVQTDRVADRLVRRDGVAARPGRADGSPIWILP